MNQFNDVLKLLMVAHEEFQQMLNEDELQADLEWFEKIDEDHIQL